MTIITFIEWKCTFIGCTYSYCRPTDLYTLRYCTRFDYRPPGKLYLSYKTHAQNSPRIIVILETYVASLALTGRLTTIRTSSRLPSSQSYSEAQYFETLPSCLGALLNPKGKGLITTRRCSIDWEACLYHIPSKGRTSVAF